MKREELQRNLLNALEKRIPDRTELLEKLMEILFMEKGAVYRRLRGDVPFSLFEAVNLAEKMNIPVYNLIYPDSIKTDRFELNIIDYTHPSEADYNEWADYIALVNSAKSDPLSEFAESSNILPLSVYGQFKYLSKFFLFKYQYQSDVTESRISYGDLVVPERLIDIYKTYYNETKNFAKTVLIWDHLIFQYLATDVRFFSGINLISADEIQLIKNDLSALADYMEEIALQGRFKETGNRVEFYISDINLYSDYSYLQINDTRLCRMRALILNSLVSPNQSSFNIIKNRIHSFIKSSTLISQSGAIYRAEFFEKQRKIIDEL